MSGGPLIQSSPSSIPRLALRPRDLAAALGVSERLLQNWRRDYGLPYVRLGETVLHPVDGVRAWLHAKSLHHESPNLN
jgi:hypothetical protein